MTQDEILCPECLADLSEGTEHDCNPDEITFYNIGGAR